MAKLNWKDYYAGAALSGVWLLLEKTQSQKIRAWYWKKGRLADSPLLKEMVSSFREYYRGFGDIILQGNYDDENLGVLDYAVTKLGVKP